MKYLDERNGAPRCWIWRDGHHYPQVAFTLPKSHIKSVEFVSVARVEQLEREVDDLQRLPQPLKGFVPQTYGDAIQAGWIKHGDCPPHEWDNRTSAANARWMLERFMTARSGSVKS